MKQEEELDGTSTFINKAAVATTSDTPTSAPDASALYSTPERRESKMSSRELPALPTSVRPAQLLPEDPRDVVMRQKGENPYARLKLNDGLDEPDSRVSSMVSFGNEFDAEMESKHLAVMLNSASKRDSPYELVAAPRKAVVYEPVPQGGVAVAAVELNSAAAATVEVAHDTSRVKEQYEIVNIAADKSPTADSSLQPGLYDRADNTKGVYDRIDESGKGIYEHIDDKAKGEYERLHDTRKGEYDHLQLNNKSAGEYEKIDDRSKDYDHLIHNKSKGEYEKIDDKAVSDYEVQAGQPKAATVYEPIDAGQTDHVPDMLMEAATKTQSLGYIDITASEVYDGTAGSTKEPTYQHIDDDDEKRRKAAAANKDFKFDV